MNEIYWITRIGALDTLFSIMWIVPLIVACVIGVVAFAFASDYEKLSSEFRIRAKRIAYRLSVIFTIGIIGDVGLPTTEQAMVIYGLGSLVDYVQSNDKAKQLPDKAVDALNRYVDAVCKESEHEINLKENKD